MASKGNTGDRTREEKRDPGRGQALKKESRRPVPGSKGQSRVIKARPVPPVKAMRELAGQALQESKGGFLSVTADEKGVMRSAVAERGMAREYARTLLGSRAYRANVVQEIAAVTSAANTAVTVSTPANYISATEYSSWAALFDEVRCVHYTVRQLIGSATGGAPLTGTCWAAAISPDINTAPTSIVQTVGFTRFLGPVPSNGTDATGSGPSIGVVTNHGLPEITSGRLQTGVSTNNSGGTMTVNPVQGNWVPTGTNSAHAGYHLLYIEASGGTCTMLYRLWIWYELEFRSRSG